MTATSRDGPKSKPQNDTSQQVKDLLSEQAPDTGDTDRDLASGEGGAIELPANPGDLSKDD